MKKLKSFVMLLIGIFLGTIVANAQIGAMNDMDILSNSENGKIEATSDNQIKISGQSDKLGIVKMPVDSDDFVFVSKFTVAEDSNGGRPMVMFIPRSKDFTNKVYYGVTYNCARGYEWQINNYSITRGGTIASKSYKLTFGKEYTAVVAISNIDEAVNIKFYLVDLDNPESLKVPLFEGTDKAKSKIMENTEKSVMFGNAGSSANHSVTYYKDMKVYAYSELETVLNQFVEGTSLAGSIADIDGHWSKNYVQALAVKKVVNGNANKAFEPNKNINVDEFTKMVVSSLGHNMKNGDKYWASTFIDKAKELGLIKEGEFKEYNVPITRGQMARIIANAANETVEDMDNYTSMILDFGDISNDFKNSVAKAFSLGIISGYQDGSFLASNNATKAEGAVMISRLINTGSRKQPELIKGVVLPKFFGDGMVLQQKAKIPVWGKGRNGDKVTVTFAGQELSTTVVGAKWRVDFNPVEAGGPYTMTIACADYNKVFNDVLVGEVWLASGQSNMDYVTVATAKGWDEESKKPENPNLRLFRGTAVTRLEPQFDIAGGEWKVSSAESKVGFSGLAYYFADELQRTLNVPVGIIQSAMGGTEIRQWMSPDVAAESKWTKPGRSSAYFNGAIAPYAPFAIKGFIWCQGESNVAETNYNMYVEGQKEMIEGWRKLWNMGDLPFIYTQNAPWIGDTPVMKNAFFREAQGSTQYLTPNASMVITVDVGEPQNIHYTEKKTIGYRMAQVAKGKFYGLEVPYKFPEFKSMEINDGKAILTFDNVGAGLVSKDDVIKGFVISGGEVDGSLKFVKAQAKNLDNNRVSVWSDEVKTPVAVRYAFENFAEYSLYNKEGFPMAPFRTDREYKLKNRDGSIMPPFPMGKD